MASGIFTDTISGTHTMDGLIADGLKCALLDDTVTGVDLNDVADSTFTVALLTASEVSGAGYTSGGVALSSLARAVVSGQQVVTADNVVFSAVTVTARYALIWDVADGASVRLIDFGHNVEATAADFPVTFSGGIVLTQSP